MPGGDGQRSSSRAAGRELAGEHLHHRVTTQLVIVEVVLYISLAPSVRRLLNMLISVLKDSSLASLISAPDIMLRANDITHGPPPGSAHAPGAGSKADVEDHLDDDEHWSRRPARP